MKKFLSLVLCISFVFMFTACGKDGNKSEKGSVDVEYYAKLGQIAEVEYKLGDDVETTKNALRELTDEHGEPLLYEMEIGDYTVMNVGEFACCYKTDDTSLGLTHIIKYGNAYGFDSGAVSTQVRDSMSKSDFDADERDAKKGEVFFLPSSSPFTVLEYTVKENTVLFVFEENALCAAVIFN